ncbi:Mth938-like domain-containing protein [Paracoccus sp. p4-l81]|uniref:Mth938-like domain-containing protein n=1 Tax=unclassified Paracoccus (in: a-proteobacteria) TaxID=2688777 RepID=UPI0035B8E243
MPLTEAEYGNRVPVDGYGPGFFRVGGAVHRGPVIVTPDGVQPWAGLDDRAALMALADRVDLLFLGMGADIAHPPQGLAEALDDAGVRVEAMSTPSAARTYNVLLSEDRSVACALLPVAG